ncbi:Isoleucine--tRNA ligase, partial [Dissostichus eleginoides]
VMAFFTVTVDTETEGDLENTATPTHPSLSMRRRVKLNQRQPLAHRGGLSISASVPLRKHQQLPDSAPQ